MKGITWHKKPELRDPTVLIGFSGWSDAADAASGTVDYVLQQASRSELLATVNAEEFYDFTEVRPEIHIVDGTTESVEWPTIRIQSVQLSGWDRDLVVVDGSEPHFRWPTLTDHLIDAFHEIGATQIVLFGAFVGRVAHTLPVPIMAVASDADLVREHQLLSAEYHGPTGIVGALNAACSRAGFPTVGLWAAISHDLAANPNPRAVMALLERAIDLADLPLDLGPIEAEAIEFHQQIEAAVADSPDLAAYIAELEDDADDLIMEPEAGEQLVNEIERFLRDPD